MRNWIAPSHSHRISIEVMVNIHVTRVMIIQPSCNSCVNSTDSSWAWFHLQLPSALTD